MPADAGALSARGFQLSGDIMKADQTQRGLNGHTLNGLLRQHLETHPH
jgi:hypothetical protein